MSTPRLKGNTLALTRKMAGTTGVGGVVWSQLSRDYGLGALRRLPPETRTTLDTSPVPLQARPPRSGAPVRFDTPPVVSGSISEIRAAYARGDTDPVEVLGGILARLERADFGEATHSPLVSLDLARARSLAHASLARWKAGEPLGPLDGVPLPLTDTVDLAGVPTRAGTRYREDPAPADATVVTRLVEAGAIPFAKTLVTEWGLNPVGFSAHHPMPRNAWSATHAPGGSAVGAAVAVALGLAPVALAADGGGSLRIPAALNGLPSLKPTFGRVPRQGCLPAESTVWHLGGIGRSASDLVALLTALSDDSATALSWSDALRRGVRGLRIGVPAAEWEQSASGLASHGQRALTALQASGAQLVNVELPASEISAAVGIFTIAGETMGLLTDDFERHARVMGDDLRLILHLLEQAPLRDYFIACRTRAWLRRQLVHHFDDLDLIALPAVASPPPPWSLADDCVAITDDEANRAMTRFMLLGNLTGLPCATVPVGVSEGLPVGLQLMGDAWDEATVFAGMATLERLGLCPPCVPPGYRACTG